MRDRACARAYARAYARAMTVVEARSEKKAPCSYLWLIGAVADRDVGKGDHALGLPFDNCQ